ncbi:MAG: hypothetical protein AAFQ36_12300 [Pseudomonadota bacterium]
MISARSLVAGVICVALFAGAAVAQERPIDRLNAFPSIFGASSAYPSRSGSGSFGLTITDSRAGQDGPDADAAASIWLGSAQDNLAVNLGIAFTGLDPFGDAGAFSVAVSRLVSVREQSATYLGASMGNVEAWGTPGVEMTNNVYLSHIAFLFIGDRVYPVQVSVGSGSATTRNTKTDAFERGGFAGIGIGVWNNVSLSASFTATQTNLGLSTALPVGPGVGVTLGVADVAENANDRQFSMSFGYGF